MTDPGSPVLRVEDLRVETDMGIEIVAEVNFEANRGEVLAIVGESGSGKTTVGMALFGYARRGTRITGGAVWYGGKDILSLRKEDLRQIRGRHVSYVPQDPGLSLSPRRKIGSQLVEAMVSPNTLRVDPGAARPTRTIRAPGNPWWSA